MQWCCRRIQLDQPWQRLQIKNIFASTKSLSFAISTNLLSEANHPNGLCISLHSKTCNIHCSVLLVSTFVLNTKWEKTYRSTHMLRLPLNFTSLSLFFSITCPSYWIHTIFVFPFSIERMNLNNWRDYIVFVIYNFLNVSMVT